MKWLSISVVIVVGLKTGKNWFYQVGDDVISVNKSKNRTWHHHVGINLEFWIVDFSNFLHANGFFEMTLEVVSQVTSASHDVN